MTDRGFSLIEALVALALTLVVTGAAFGLVNPSATMAQAQPEAMDMQQRIRVATEALIGDLKMAGAGMTVGPHPGGLVAVFAPILPRRIGLQSPDGNTVARADAITVTYVPSTWAQTTVSGPTPQPAGLTVDSGANCPAGQVLCGFRAGMTAAVFDATSHFDLFSLTQVQAGAGQWQLHGAGSGYLYPAGAPVTEVESFTYYLDAAASQLRRYDGYQTDVPVADNVVGLTFEYLGDPQPPIEPRPPLGTDNCLYDTAGNLKPLPILAATAGALAPLPLSSLSDGPWCGSGATQFDADLLRVRMVRASVRVQASPPEFRASGVGFAKSGTSREANRYLPDVAATFVVAPRNLNAGR